jgi:predicted transcriptional regulator
MCAEKKVLQEMAETMKVEQIAANLGVSPSLVWQVIEGRCQSPKIRRALGIRKEAVDRLAARVSVDRGAAIRAKLAYLGYDTVTEFWEEFLDLMEDV